MIALPALLIGMVAGLRSMTAPTAVGWAAHVGAIDLAGTWLAFLGHWSARWALTLSALGELVVDKLPSTPSRRAPLPFAGRIVTGGLSGAAMGAAGDATIVGLAAGAIGAIAGTLGGSALRARLASMTGSDGPAAFIEDAIALAGALVVVSLLGARSAQ